MGVRAAIALALGALAGAWTSQAVGQVPGVTVTTPTISVPTISVPTISVPTPTVPTPTPSGSPSSEVSSAVQSAGTAAGSVTEQGTGALGSVTRQGTGARGSVTGQGTGALGVTRSEQARSQQAKPSREKPKLRTSRRSFKNERQRGEPYGTTFSFWIGRAAIVTFSIRREAPDCVFIGTFGYRAHKGVNRVNWFGRYRGERLPAGTYRITATVERGARTISLGSVRVAIAPTNRDADKVRPQRSTCTGSEGTAAAAASSTGESGSASVASAPAATAQKPTSDVAGTTASGTQPAAGSSRFAGDGAADEGAVLGVIPDPFEDAPAWLRPLLLGALALAILLLLLAALPATAVRPTGAGTAVAERRTDLAVAGALILATVAVAALVL